MPANRTSTAEARPVVMIGAVALLRLCFLAVIHPASSSSSSAVTFAFSPPSYTTSRELRHPSLSVSFSYPRSTITSASRRGRCGCPIGGIVTCTSPPYFRGSSVAAAPLRALREATFGMGCFWEPAESLLDEKGVLATAVGYTGAPPDTKKPPTYDSVCFGNAWVEAVRVAYDDDILSYDALLDRFFELQKPMQSRQYASVIFVDDEHEHTTGGAESLLAEKESLLAERWKKNAVRAELKRSDGLPATIVAIEPLSTFYRAEEYHQEYWKKLRWRAAVAVALLSGASGAYSSVLPATVPLTAGGNLSTDTLFNGAFLVGAVWVLVERLIARDVRVIAGGELVNSVREGLDA